VYLTRNIVAAVRPKLDTLQFQRHCAAIRDLVYEFRNQEATNPRDKIYTFLGLATDLQENDITPQYSNTEAAVCTNFAKFLLTKNEPGDLPLKLLAVCFRRSQWLDREKLQAKIKTLDD
jgi:hypothetical protein